MAASAVRAEATPHPSRHLRTAHSTRKSAWGVGAGSAYSQGCQAPTDLRHWGRQGPTRPMGATRPAAGSSSHSAHIRRSAPKRMCIGACAKPLSPADYRRRARQGLPNHQTCALTERVPSGLAPQLCAVMAVPTRTATVCCGGQRQCSVLQTPRAQRVVCAGWTGFAATSGRRRLLSG